MPDGETPEDMPGFRENSQYSDEELEDMANEELDRESLADAMERDAPYVDYAFALPKFLAVASVTELREARRAIDAAIVSGLLKANTLEDAAAELRAETKEAMREFKIPDPTRKPRDDAGKKRK
jgi:hypothetical protein